jgi:hypothetical protein
MIGRNGPVFSHLKTYTKKDPKPKPAKPAKSDTAL